MIHLQVQIFYTYPVAMFFFKKHLRLQEASVNICQMHLHCPV